MLRSFSSIVSLRLGLSGLLGRLRLHRLGGRLDVAAGGFDRLARRLARGVHLHGQRHLELTAREQLDRLGDAHEARLLEPRQIHRRAGAGLRDAADLHHLVFDPMMVVEATLREAPLDGHLATLEARRNLAAGARLVTLVSLAGGATQTGRAALAAPLLGARRARGGMNLSQSHELTLRFFHLEEVADLEDHAPNLRRVGVLDDLMQTPDAERLHGGLLRGLLAAGAPDLTNAQLTRHGSLPCQTALPASGHGAPRRRTDGAAGAIRQWSRARDCADCASRDTW